MSPFVLVAGLSIFLNAGMFGEGLVWSKRQVKRVAAERVAEYRGLFKLEPLPSPGDGVQVLVEDDDGRASELEAVHWPHLGWTDTRSCLRIEEDVLGWRPHPDQKASPTDYATWSREKLAAKIELRYGDDA